VALDDLALFALMAAAAAGHRMDLSISRPYIDTASTYWRGREKVDGKKEKIKTIP
jgi:hypothetical protein